MRAGRWMLPRARARFAVFPSPRNESRRRHLYCASRGCVLSTSAIRRPVVLIVEDEFLLRMNAAEMISDAGFNVVEAGNADEAIAILEARPDIHVVFTDFQMPGSMDGLKSSPDLLGADGHRSRSSRPRACFHFRALVHHALCTRQAVPPAATRVARPKTKGPSGFRQFDDVLRGVA